MKVNETSLHDVNELQSNSKFTYKNIKQHFTDNYDHYSNHDPILIIFSFYSHDTLFFIKNY